MEYWNGGSSSSVAPRYGGRLVRGGKRCKGKVIERGVEKGGGLWGTVVEMLPEGDNFSAQFCILLKQIRDAVATIENGRVIAAPQ